jgi:hypothetical protein
MDPIVAAQVASDLSSTQCAHASVEEHADTARPPRPSLLNRISEAVRAAHTASVPF